MMVQSQGKLVKMQRAESSKLSELLWCFHPVQIKFFFVCPEFCIPCKRSSVCAHEPYQRPERISLAIFWTCICSFGAKVLGRRTGILFNDLMDNFAKPGPVSEFAFVYFSLSLMCKKLPEPNGKGGVEIY